MRQFKALCLTIVVLLAPQAHAEKSLKSLLAKEVAQLPDVRRELINVLAAQRATLLRLSVQSDMRIPQVDAIRKIVFEEMRRMEDGAQAALTAAIEASLSEDDMIRILAFHNDEALQSGLDKLEQMGPSFAKDLFVLKQSADARTNERIREEVSE